MAFVTTIFCKECGEEKQCCFPAGANTPSICNDCNLNAKDKLRREWLAGREGLSIEERIRDLEKFMHDHLQVNHYRGLRF